MDKTKDSILKDKESPSITDGNNFPFFRDGLDAVNLLQKQVDFVGKKFTEIFEHNGSSRNGLVMARGAVFAIGSRKYGNEEWREHAASSIRELLHRWKRNAAYLADDFKKTFISKNKSFPTVGTHRDEYGRITAYYSYFSCICHHEANDIIICARQLDGDSRKSGHDSEEDFLKKVEDFFRFFDQFFSEHAK